MASRLEDHAPPSPARTPEEEEDIFDSGWGVRFKTKVLQDSAERIKEGGPWYETLGLKWRVTIKGGGTDGDRDSDDDNPPVDEVLTFNVLRKRIASVHKTLLAPVLEILKELLNVIRDETVRDEVVELVEYCLGVSRGALEAAKREEISRAIPRALEDLRTEMEGVVKFARASRVPRTGCCWSARLSERDRRRVMTHREKLHNLLDLVLAALAVQSFVDSDKLVRMVFDGGSEGGGDNVKGNGVKLAWKHQNSAVVDAGKLADVPREAPLLPTTYIDRLAAVERVVLDLIDPSRRSSAVHCIVGPEGSGKTLLASAVVRERRVQNSFRGGIFWFTAGRDGKVEDVAPFLDRMPRDLAIAARRNTEISRRRQPNVQRRFFGYSEEDDKSLRYLVVVDDAWDEEIVKAFLNAGFHALVSARHREVIPWVNGGLFSEMGEMSRGEAVELLRSTSGASEPLSELAAVQVAGDCAMLPLALNVVGALARERPLEAATWQGLHDELRTKRVELFEAEPEPEAHLFAAVDAGIDHLPEPQKERFSLLAVMSPGAIATTDMLANLWDMDAGDAQAGADFLVGRNLLQAVPEGYRLNGSILEYLRLIMQSSTLAVVASARQVRYLSRPELLLHWKLQHQQRYSGLCGLVGLWRAAISVNDGSGSGDAIFVERCYAESLGALEAPDASIFWREAGRVAVLLGEFDGAERMFEKALTILIERDGGGDTEDIATALKDLGKVLESQGKLEGASRVYARAIDIGEKDLFGENGGPYHTHSYHHRNRDRSLKAPGDDQWRKKYESTVFLYRRAIETEERLLGRDHPDLAQRIDNLAKLLGVLGKYAEAESLYERSQAIRETTWGPDHPTVASSLNNRAELLRARGEYSEAEPLARNAQAILERSMGPNHPNVAVTVTNRAELLEAQGKYAEAESLRLRATEIWEKSHGPDHHLVAVALGSRAGVLRHQGKYAEAEVLYDRATIIWENVYGPDHPLVATAMNNHAAVMKALGRFAEADPLYIRSIEIGEKTLGAEHPTVATRLGNRAKLQAAQGNHQEAVDLLKRAVAIRSKALGEEHKDTKTFQEALESVRKVSSSE